MNKQEEIRRGLYKKINNMTRGLLAPTLRRQLRDVVLVYLHSQGVGKRGQENPRYPGWFRFESLIEEKE